MTTELPPTGDGAASASLDHLVVVGSSAGGIEALSTLLGGLKRDFPAPVVLAQHLDPGRQSHLQTILQRKTELPIVLVSEAAPLKAGSVYVVPANRHVVVSDGTVRLEADHGGRPRPSVDLLLTTAAQSYGERLVAVILTGAGSDGAAGAVEVKQAGGTVIIQNPRTARYPSMPLALPPTVIDHVVDLERLPDLLRQLLDHPVVPKASEPIEKSLSHVVELVSRQSSVDFRPYKTSTVLRRITRRMAATQMNTLDDYAQYLEAHPEEIGQLASSLLINVTEFFRDPDAFLFLRNTVLPELVERARQRGRSLRLWSAGCSTGEEAYSLVITLADLLGPELPEWNIKVFATDVDDQAVAFARRGLYPSNVLGSLPDDYQSRFFEPAEQGFRINKPLRQMVIFGMQDIGHGVPFPRIDLVVCRNLLIYFRQELQQDVLDIFAYSLHPTNGYLFVGKAETARPSKSTFEMVNKKYKVYRCVSGPSGRIKEGIQPRALIEAKAAGDEGAPTSAAPPETAMEIAHLRRFNELVLRAMPVGLVVIDKNYRMVTSNPAARRMLQIHDQVGEPDFLHAVRGIPYNEVRASIDAAFRERGPTTLPELSLPGGGDERFVHFTISRIPSDGAGGEYAVISIMDVSETVRGSRRLHSSQEEQRLLVDELSATNKRLGDVNKDLQDANEELQAANEELMLAQEEMQATNEEFEATNEELQATNEELETTNEELSARSGELQELTRILTAERGRLQEMVELAPFCMVVMKGPGLIVEALNPMGTAMLGVDDAVRRPFEEVFTRDADLVSAVRASFRDDKVWTSPPRETALGKDGGRSRTFAFTVVPTHEDGKVDGIVLYGEDVTGTTPRPGADARTH